MHKDDAKGKECPKHSRNTSTGKAGHNRKVRRKVNEAIRKDTDEISGKKGYTNK